MTDNESEATHIVHSVADPLEEEYARPHFRRDRNTLLHWLVLNNLKPSFSEIHIYILLNIYFTGTTFQIRTTSGM